MTSPGPLLVALAATALSWSAAPAVRAAAAPANFVKIVSAAVPNGIGGKMYVKVAACARAQDVALTVATAEPAGSGQATAPCTNLTQSIVITVAQDKGPGQYARGTPIGIHAMSATSGDGVTTKVEQQKIVTPT